MRTSTMQHLTRVGTLFLALSGVTAVAGAQLPNASPAATGLSGAYTALARGYDAVAWNPANLGLPGNPGFSIGILALSGASGLDPISLNDVAPYSKKNLPSDVRQKWLQSVQSNNGETGSVDGGISELGLSIKHLAFQVATSVGVTSTLNPDAVNALLFGNVDQSGAPKTLNFAGSRVHIGAFTTGALSYGLPLGDAHSTSHLAIGATGKYILGNFLALAQDQGSTAGANSVTVNLPMVYSSPDSGISAGSGFGLDLGMAWTGPRLSIGATVQNVMNTFVWDESKMLSKTGSALFDGNTNDANFTDQPYASAPASLRAQVENDTFKPVIAGGLAYALNGITTISADVREQVGDGITFGPKSQVAGGLEFRGIPLLPIRIGAAAVTGGWGFSGGVGLKLAGYELGVGAGLRTINSGKEPTFTLNVLNIR